MSLTKRQMNAIMDNNTINRCTESEKKQVFNYAFGTKFMKSNNKGQLAYYG